MKITEVHFRKNELNSCGINLGLDSEIHLQKLGRTVVLAGPNGAGKSRFLRAIMQMDQYRRDDPETIRTEISSFENSLVHFRNCLNNPNEAPHHERYKKEILTYESYIATKTSALRRWEMISSSPKEKIINPVAFVPKETALHSPEELTSSRIRNSSTEFRNLGMGDAKIKAPAYIKHVLQTAFNAKVPDSHINESNREEARKNGEELSEILKKILGDSSDPHYTLDSQISIFGRTDYADTLSDGQKILLQMGAALHAQGVKLNEALLFLDEPENHLHPAALIEVVSKLENALTDGQIWIATHSVPLIAHLAYDDPACLWFVHEGEIKHAGRKPELVLEGLLGKEDGTERLRQFTQLPMQLAANRFLAECLLPPGTVGPDAADPQTNQIRKIIKDLAEKKGGKPLRVLDYGAGQGRLLSAFQTAGVSCVDWLDYFAFDAYPDDKERCQATIAQAYSGKTTQNRYFNSMSSLSTECDAGSFDLIVMCNVLHEIDPDEWLDCLGKNSVLKKLLINDGFLLIVEDYGMPTGENAHRHGFILLNEAELKCLFEIKEKDHIDLKYLKSDARNDDPKKMGRLKAHLIRAELLSRISDESRLNAITELKRNSERTIKQLRLENPDSKKGQIYALAAQLYANASIWLAGRGK